MRDVRLDGEDEGVRLVTVEEPHRYLVVAAPFRGAQSVDAVDDPHRRAVRDDGRQRCLCHRQHLHMFDVFPGYARRAGHRERIDLHLDDRLHIQVRLPRFHSRLLAL